MIFCGFATILLFFLYKIIFQGDFPYRRYTMACANNLRHTYTALMQYANQNKGYFGSSALCAKNGKRIAGPPVQSSLNPA